MSDTQPAIKLEEIMGRPVPKEDAWDVADYLMACLTHVTNARPLFGVLCLKTGLLDWTAGGAEFHELLDPLAVGGGGEGSEKVSSFRELFMCFGIGGQDIDFVLEDAQKLSPGGAMTVLNPLPGKDDKFYRLVMRRRFEPHERQVQFSLMDITAFQETAERTRAMASALVADMDEMIDAQPGARAQLLSVLGDLDRLFTLHDDAEITALSQDMSARVTRVSEHMVKMLLSFEGRYDTGHWQPSTLNPSLRPVISVHNVPVQNWHELHGEVLRTIDDMPGIIPEVAEQMRHALSFVQNATSTLMVSPTKGRIFALNGPAAEQQFETVEDFVRAIGVEENSTRTAVDFFTNLSAEPTLGLFAVNGSNVEAWGRPGLYGGWQAMMLPGAGQGVDVRGLFHGLKNLLLHLQVLYVVHTRADVEQVQEGLAETAEKISCRLAELEAVAKTGHRAQRHARTTVAQWLKAAQRVGDEVDGEVEVACDGVSGLSFQGAASEMEDTFEELVRNAFQHGAKRVQVDALGRGDHLCLHVIDDGRGMADDKLDQVKRVLKSREYDPTLTTRKDGTGNGLLAAANAVSSFVDGQLMVDHGPDGRGVKITMSMKLPA